MERISQVNEPRKKLGSCSMLVSLGVFGSIVYACMPCRLAPCDFFNSGDHGWQAIGTFVGNVDPRHFKDVPVLAFAGCSASLVDAGE